MQIKTRRNLRLFEFFPPSFRTLYLKREAKKAKEIKKMEINFPFFFFFLTFAYRKQCSGLSLAFRYWRARGKSGQHRASHFRN